MILFYTTIQIVQFGIFVRPNKYRKMKIAILGTGSVGSIIGSKLISLGHNVMMGSRTSTNEKAQAFVEKNGYKLASNGTFSDAAAYGEILFNCVKGEVCLQALQMTGTAMNGKILIDLANPLDFSQGMPPGLIPAYSNFNSLGEEIQKQFPEVYVVKTFNTMWCGLMVDPQQLNHGDHVNYISGNHQPSKDRVKELLCTFGWPESSLIDLGDISNARATEAVLPIWLRLYGVGKSAVFNFKIVR